MAETGSIIIDGYFSKKGIEKVKAEVIKRFQNREKTQSYYNFINWEKKDNQILVGTFHAPYNLQLLESLDYVFNQREPNEFTFQEYKIVHSLWNGWIPAESVSQGNNHILALEFQKNIPELLLKLYEENEFYPKAPQDGLRLGLCRKADFELLY